MRRNLGPGGLLMFDTNTTEAYRGFFAEEIVVERTAAADLARPLEPRCAPGSITEASFEVEPLAEGLGPPIAPELHRERHFPEAELLAALERTGLECLDVFGYTDEDGLQQPLLEGEHYKAIYIARAV